MREYVHIIPVIVFMALFVANTPSNAQDQQLAKNTEWIKLSSPAEGTLVIGKKPVINCVITIPFAKENIIIW